jgi:hypothetical protein
VTQAAVENVFKERFFFEEFEFFGKVGAGRLSFDAAILVLNGVKEGGK